ncbi:MAG: ABC transporter substrate-binding protein [Chloroflexi bacterium]|nr:ABC transporter substrate-binding protein [Chloroflexota bacterium]
MHSRLRALITALGLLALLAGCAPAAAPTPPPKATAPPAKAAATATAPTSKPATPAAKPAAPAATPKPATGEPRYGGTLTGWDAIEPEHLDIHQANSGGTLWPIAPVYNGLIQHHPTPPHNVVSELAQKWEAAPDGKSFTFTLAPGVKWHDGKPFTPEDVKFSLDRMWNPPSGTISPRKAVYSSIGSVETLGADKVKVNLKHPSPSIINAIAIGWSVILPKHVIEAKGDMKKDAIGTGPFKFREYVPGSQVVLEKNKDYFVKGQPYVDGIRWFIIKDKSVQMAAFRTKRVMVTGYGSRGISPIEADLLKKEIPSVGIYAYPAGGAGQTLAFNVTKPPFDDVRARRAAVMAIDQQEIIRVGAQGGAAVSGPLGPPGEWTLPEAEMKAFPGIRKPTADVVAEARKLLAEAGHPNGIKTGYPFRAASQFGEIAEVVQEQLAKVGIDITLQRLEAGVYQDTQRKRNWDLIQSSHVYVLDDPDGLLVWYISGSPNNFSGFSDKQVDELYAKQSQTMDAAERKKIVNQIERRLIEQVPMLRLFEWTFMFAHWPDVKGYTGVGMGPMNNSRWAHVWLAQ